MKWIGSYKKLIFFTVIIFLVLYLFIGKGSKKASKIDLNAYKPVALVRTEPIKKDNITEDITVYGITIPAPGAVQTISVPFESQVKNVMVTDGQEVSKGDALLEIKPSPDSKLQLEQAKNTYESSKLSLQHFERLFGLKLATNDQVTQAKQTFQQAELNLESLKKRGINGMKKINSNIQGLIKTVQVQEGEIVPAGGTLMQIVVQNRLETRLGIEPDDIQYVKVDQEVFMSPVNVNYGIKVRGKIRKISGSVNPNTHLVDVFVSFPELSEKSHKFLLDEFILGKVSIASSSGFIVSRSAVLPEDARHKIFTVKNGIAVEHYVQIDLEDENEIEISGADLKAGDSVVVLGNYELKDGMAVKVETSK
jgi:membrane fusion protein, multidrug efflux system